MLKKNLSKSALVVALLTTTVIWRGTTAYAEDPNQAFTLDPMIVTAQRTETRDLDTPATTNIITEQNIKEAGYKNVFDAIEHQVGLTSTGYGDAGQDFGFSSGRTVIRGYDRGTLVMVDGIPMNLKNYNSLDGIPIDMVQQIEIIKGAAGTLYGSEAMGGDIYEVFWKQNPDDYGGRDVMEHDWEFYYAKYADPNYKENLYKSDQYQLDKLESAERWRKANDYKNTDAIIKWQDDHWLAKATWKNIRRHLPHPIDNNYAPLWTVDQDWAVNMPYGKPNMYYFRNQELTAKELLLGRRDTVGNLEWGWSINYLKQDKDYYIDDWQNLEKVLEATNSLNTLSANSLWSKYDSRRLGAKIDGSYKAGDRHLIEFLVDASKEKMDIDGWRMHDFENSSEDTRGRWRNYYEQEIFNAQVQDTITLNKKGDFWLTPSVRYNRSKILGRSDRYDEKNDPQNVKWFHQQDEQTDDKVTWQLALKKQFNDHFTLRATGGTYYRLLNMYEIAGDGAGIWPMPNVDGTDSVFPMPEEGKQWDVSAIWDGKALGADTAKFQLTYFGRDSENLLQLMSRNFFFFYTNAAKAKVNGLEIQADMSWQKWDVNLQATYTKPKDVFYDMTKLPGYDSNTIAGSLTYQPQWEGTARLTYRPDTNWSLFTQLRYVDWMVTDPIPLTTGAVKRQSSLTTMDVGVKYKFNKSLQLAVGCNDVLNKANDMYLNMYGNGEIRNIQYPIQGRTYYATLQYTY